MKKFLLFLALLSLSHFAMAWQTTIYGYVKLSDGTAKSAIPVSIKLQTGNNTFTPTQTVQTNGNGKYWIEFSLESNLSEATAFVKLINCNGDEVVKSGKVTKNHAVLQLDFIWCESVNCHFDVKVEKYTTSAGDVRLKAIPLGGKGPYTFHWNNGETSETIAYTDNKKYCVIVTDHEGCKGDACFESVSKDCSVKIEAVALDNSGSTYKLHAKATGQEPFTYHWSDGSKEPWLIVKASGEYCVVIVDANGCEAKACYTFKTDKDCAVEIHASPSNVPNGLLQLKAIAKGKEPFTYKWSTGETTQHIYIKEPGVYCVTIVDANGCEAKACYTVKGDKDCAVEITIQYDGNKAKLTAHTKGTAPFSFKWSTGSHEQHIIVEQSGEYCVVIVDANGCEAKACIKVQLGNSKDCAVEIISVPVNANTGGLMLKAIPKGQEPFTYLWSTGETTQSITVKGPGEYCVLIKDAHGCEAKSCFTVKETKPTPCSVHIKVKYLKGEDVYRLRVAPIGFGTFKIEWSTGETGKSINVKEAGLYCVTITDSKGCTASACIEIDDDNLNEEDQKSSLKILKKYPNPVSDILNLQMELSDDGNLQFDLYNLWGNVIYHKLIDNVSSGKQEITLTLPALQNGTYVLVVHHQNGSNAKELITIIN